jgi:LuxR family transcriptional regulator, maltose regulon positive regulatory protein
VIPILATKLHMPSPRPHVVNRPRLIEHLNEGLHRKLTLISAPAGFGKTTLVSAWLAGRERPAAWLSLDAGDKDTVRFLTYLVAALQTLAPAIGVGAVRMLESPQLPTIEAILTDLLNDVSTLSGQFVLMLDDYHALDSKAIDWALTYLVEHLPPQLHLVIATREDPRLPLARLRAGDHLSELRVADLRFTPAEAAEFLTQVMALRLSASDIAALEKRTEGWIAGLQLAALSLQGHSDATSFIASFTGSHQFVMDYLVEEVLQQQSEDIQTFLLRTSILERLCGPLCEAVALTPPGSGQATLELLDRANLFLVPLDQTRQWYRYHHLFADLLRQRLHQSIAASAGEAESQIINALHLRASHWYEERGLAIEAFHHAAAAQDVDLAFHLVQGRGIPLHHAGAVTAMLDWMASLPRADLEARPALLVRYASLQLVNGQAVGVEEKLQAAEAILQRAEQDDKTRDLLGQIATARATLATNEYQIESMLLQSHRALEYLYPRNLVFRTTAHWTLGVAYFLQGERAAAREALAEALALSQTAGNVFFTLLATIGLGQVQEADNQLYPAADTYREILRLAGDKPLPVTFEAHLGLARIYYQWNDLEAAERHGQESLRLARQYDSVVERFIPCEVFLARLKLARGDMSGAAALLAGAERSAHQQGLVYRMPEVAAEQVVIFLRQGHLTAAAQLAEKHDLPLCRARVHLAQGNPSAALAVLEQWRGLVEARRWEDARLKVLVLQALTLQAQGEANQAVSLLVNALALAEPGGFVRVFVDEGLPMSRLLSAAAPGARMPDYIGKLVAICQAEVRRSEAADDVPARAQSLVEPLSRREEEVLQLIAKGLSNQEIAGQLVLAVETVKGHNKRIFGKLQVQRRTEAVARARELGLL